MIKLQKNIVNHTSVKNKALKVKILFAFQSNNQQPIIMKKG